MNSIKFIFIAVFLINTTVSSSYGQLVKIPVDGKIELAATINIVDEEWPSVVLLHQCNRDQTMWNKLIDELRSNGFNTLAVDMRGYGKSASDAYNIENQDYDYVTKHFKKDIDHVNRFWRDELPNSKYRVVIGASCGGGLASKTAILYEDIKAMVLISPSLRPHWLDQELRKKLSEKKELPVLAIASEEDKNALKYIEEVFEENSSPNTQKLVYKGQMHGEPIFKHDPELIPYIVNWILRVN